MFGLHSSLIPKCQGVARTAFLIPFSSKASLGLWGHPVKNQLDCSRSVRSAGSAGILPALVELLASGMQIRPCAGGVLKRE